MAKLSLLKIGLIVMILVGTVSSAYAKGCDDVSTNPEWGKQLQELNNAYMVGDYEKGLQLAESLNQICDRSPILHYTIAKLYRRLDNKEEEIAHLQLALDSTKDFAVSDEVLERIWSEEFSASHPNATQEELDAHKAKLESYKAELNTKFAKKNRRHNHNKAK